MRYSITFFLIFPVRVICVPVDLWVMIRSPPQTKLFHNINTALTHAACSKNTDYDVGVSCKLDECGPPPLTVGADFVRNLGTQDSGGQMTGR